MCAAYLDPTTSRVLPLRPSSPDDRYFDYCLEPYAPRRPTAGGLRSENLLWHALQIAGTDEALRAPLEAVRASVGTDMTVWGVKWDGARLWTELYFYDPQKEDPAATLTRLSGVLAPWLEVAPQVDERVPYMMVSFDLDERALAERRIDAVNLYLTGEAGHAGRAYEVRKDGAELTNTYRFLRAKPDAEQIVALIRASLFTDFSERSTLAKVLLPQLFACKKICVAKKRRADGIYFSGIAIEQLIWFLETFGYPAPLVELLRKQESKLEHLFFDVGFDYRWDAAGRKLEYLKSSYYGTL